jgi:hypothetical protein
MEVTINAGWWILPMAVTVIAFSLSVFVSRDDGSHGDYSAIAGAFVSLVLFGAATTVSLIAWLIWALAA